MGLSEAVNLKTGDNSVTKRNKNDPQNTTWKTKEGAQVL